MSYRTGNLLQTVYSTSYMHVILDGPGMTRMTITTGKPKRLGQPDSQKGHESWKDLKAGTTRKLEQMEYYNGGSLHVAQIGRETQT